VEHFPVTCLDVRSETKERYADALSHVRDVHQQHQPDERGATPDNAGARLLLSPTSGAPRRHAIRLHGTRDVYAHIDNGEFPGETRGAIFVK